MLIAFELSFVYVIIFLQILGSFFPSFLLFFFPSFLAFILAIFPLLFLLFSPFSPALLSLTPFFSPFLQICFVRPETSSSPAFYIPLYQWQAKEKLIEKQIRQNQEAEMKSLLTAQKRDYDVRKEQIKRDLGDANTPKRQREDSLRAHKESFEYSQAEEGQRYVIAENF